jgi:hypothetical protein
MGQPEKRGAKPTDKKSLQPYGKSLSQFCQFVNKYITASTDPVNTAITCETRAEAVLITKKDVSPDTIDLLFATLLNVIAHLEKKWLNERLQRVDMEQNYLASLHKIFAVIDKMMGDSYPEGVSHKLRNANPG